MKSAHVFPISNTEMDVRIQELPVPSPAPDQVLIKVMVAGTNPKDFKQVVMIPSTVGLNTGDDIAGHVEAVGSNVTEFRVGDRVAAFHEMGAPFGAFAEYAIAWEKSTFQLPKATSFEEAATIPLTAMTAAMALFAEFRLPEPWIPMSQAQKAALAGGVVVYGAATAVGAFIVKLLIPTNVHPIICVAGRGIAFVKGLIEKARGDTVIDYRKGEDAVVAGIRDAIPNGQKLMYAVDAISEKGTYPQILKVLDAHGHINFIFPGTFPDIPKTIQMTTTRVGSAHGDPHDLMEFAYVWFRYLSLGLKEGWLTGHPHEVLPGGLASVQNGLQNLINGKASAVKYVYRLDETEGVKRV
jgi:NADPH:quinone reductase-like Zn-dependent oxidoreductase